MYSIEVDTHTHSVVAVHAYSTIEENVREAFQKGIRGIVSTDHGPALSPFDNTLHFYNLDLIPKVFRGVRFFKGAEVNILDKDGTVDLTSGYLKRLDFVLAGYHSTGGEWNEQSVTEGYLNVLNNPYIHCLAHIGQPAYKCNYELVVKEAKKQGKVIEINNTPYSLQSLATSKQFSSLPGLI